MTDPLAIDDGALLHFEAFALASRFSAERHSLPDAETLARMRPLGRECASQLAARLARLCEGESTAPLAFRSDDAPGTVRQRLQDLPIRADVSVILSWNATTALLTEWAIFVAHWDDFCYPASDDVTIVPRAGEWALRYRRYEVFQFWQTWTPPAADRRTP